MRLELKKVNPDFTSILGEIPTVICHSKVSAKGYILEVFAKEGMDYQCGFAFKSLEMDGPVAFFDGEEIAKW